jgi:hypothetical protein
MNCTDLISAVPTPLPEAFLKTLQNGLAKTCFPAFATPLNEFIMEANTAVPL